MPPPPLPNSSMPTPDTVLITGDREKLPPDVAPLVDPAIPLPSDVLFFEKRITIESILMAGVSSGVLAVLGVLSLLVFIYDLFDSSRHTTVATQVSFWPMGFALTCGIAAWIMASTVFERLRLRADQQAGRPTRVGILLTPTTLIEATESAWTVIPRSAVSGVTDGKVNYRANEQDKTFTLPTTIIDSDRATLERLILQWQVSE